MLQNLLTERFHLTLHHEPKVLSVYILSVAAGGPKLKPSPAGRRCASGAAYSGSGGESRFPMLAPGRTEAHGWRDKAYYTYRQTMAAFALSLGALVSVKK